MRLRYPKSIKRLVWSMGLSAFLAAPPGKPLLSLLITSAFADEPASCSNVEMAPELLALADWPLDKGSSQTCGSSNASADLGPPIEIDVNGAIPTVAAQGYDGPAGITKSRSPSVRRRPLGPRSALDDEPLKNRASQATVSHENSEVDLGTPVEIAANDPIPTVLAAGYETLAVPKPPADSIRRRLAGQRLALDSRALDEIRGGFEPSDSSLKFSFGIERAVYINGQLVASTVLNIRDLQGATGAGVVPASVDAAGMLVVQNGSGNAFQVQMGPNAFGTVVQNTLDNQKIQSVTTINAAVNSAQVLRAMSIQSAIQNGLVDSLRR